MNKIFTGVGSRSAPVGVCEELSDIAEVLAHRGYMLRSGGADGADLAFERGADAASGKKEIYLPWKGFNGSDSTLYQINKPAYELASTIHPAWHNLSQGAQKLHARNCYQVLGASLDKPSDFLLCWTENGERKGGTRTAMMLAAQHNIPIYNFALSEDRQKFYGDLYEGAI